MATRALRFPRAPFPRLRLPALVIALALQAVGAAQEVVPDAPAVEVELQPAADGGAPSWTFEHAFDEVCRFYLWCVSDSQPLVLHVEALGKEASVEDRAPAGLPAYVPAETAAGLTWRFTITAEEAQEPVAVRVRFTTSTETDETRALHERAMNLLREAHGRIRARDGEGARAALAEVAEEIASTPGWRASRQAANLCFDTGSMARRAGDNRLAIEMFERAIAFAEARFPAQDRWLLAARMNRVIACRNLGWLEEARAGTEECLTTFLTFLPEDHDDVIRTRANLSSLMMVQGEYSAARAMLERVIEAWSAKLPEDHVDLIKAQRTLATFLMSEGDVAGALEMNERCLELFLRTLAPSDRAVLTARSSLAAALAESGRPERALEMLRTVVEDARSTFPENHPAVVHAKEGLALTLSNLGRHAEALELGQEVLDARLEISESDHPEVLDAKNNLALYLDGLGRTSEAVDLHEEILAVRIERLPEHHPQIFATRTNLLRCQALVGSEEEILESSRDLYEFLRGALEAATLERSPREVEATAAKFRFASHRILSIAAGTRGRDPLPELDETAFQTVELLRGSGLRSARVLARAREDAELEQLRRTARRSAESVARIAESDERTDLLAAVLERDQAQKALLAHLSEMGGARDLSSVSVEGVADRLRAHQAAVSYWSYAPDDEGSRESDALRLTAFVVRSDRSVGRVDLGLLADVDRAVQAWRQAVGVKSADAPPPAGAEVERGVGLAPSPGDPTQAGRKLRSLILDPLEEALEGCSSWILVPDGTLHAVAFDALPFGAEGEVLGDHRAVHVRSALWELLEDDERAGEARRLTIAGAIDYDASPGSARTGPSSGALVSHLRAGSTTSFAALPFTASEVENISELAEEAALDVVCITGADVTRDRLWDSAPGTHWLHLATHGYFASDSLQVVSRPGAAPDSEVRGISPMSLCGLALAGANAAPDALDRVRGVVTAEELATFDLSACELAVLSACETHVGVQSAGQGFASLQKALHMAGARSVVTSIWSVPDEATAQLMTHFYRHLWRDGETKHRALWLAKQQLRADGRPARDWAGWVLTGAPD